jgi:hypothetical protein
MTIWFLIPLSTIFQLNMWRSVLFVEETGVPGENKRPAANYWVSLNPADGEVYLIQHYVIEFASNLQQVFCFLQVLQFPLQIKLTARETNKPLLSVHQIISMCLKFC